MWAYKKLDIWKRIDAGTVVRFQCLERTKDGVFAVQNADFFRDPLTVSEMQRSDRQFLELFFEEEPTDRCKWYRSVDEAIAAHERDFEDMPGSL